MNLSGIVTLALVKWLLRDQNYREFSVKRITCEGTRAKRAAPCLDASRPVLAGSDIEWEAFMGINNEREIEANLQIGPTDQGMVRIFVEANGIEIPMDFTSEEALEIAEEIAAAAKVIG